MVSVVGEPSLRTEAAGSTRDGDSRGSTLKNDSEVAPLTKSTPLFDTSTDHTPGASSSWAGTRQLTASSFSYVAESERRCAPRTSLHTSSVESRNPFPVTRRKLMGPVSVRLRGVVCDTSGDK
jgi:hypothetical protein